jgi:hypothetical protein
VNSTLSFSSGSLSGLDFDFGYHGQHQTSAARASEPFPNPLIQQNQQTPAIFTEASVPQDPSPYPGTYGYYSNIASEEGLEPAPTHHYNNDPAPSDTNAGLAFGPPPSHHSAFESLPSDYSAARDAATPPVSSSLQGPQTPVPRPAPAQIKAAGIMASFQSQWGVITKEDFSTRYPVYQRLMEHLKSLTLWLALDDEDFPWDLVLIHSNGDHNQSVLTQVAARALIMLPKAHSRDSDDVLEKGTSIYLC